ncbi:PREDICTED: neurocan core protein-like isoform X1 [Acropora digitifera]|uniref:neurocan core protein-like isoform X1 n=1 Tax=Acropora digitifera TaxID=70779 RepID=UPI00077A43DB|nr:PREDICTED: neurocan core protein-like isoform X1 [Acropora digitifera]
MEMFEFLVNFKRLLLLILLSLAHAGKETSADETTVAVSRKGITQRFEFVNFKQDKFSFLNITALAKRVVKDSLSCVFSCLDNLACFSFNLAAFPDEAGQFVCEILSSDKYNNSENFHPSKALHHFGIVSPCSNLPCKNKGKCVTLYETNSYVCVCNNEFTGKHCEMADTCPAGFLIHGKSCYYVANTSSASTWNKSRIFCQNLGADLAVIKSKEENQFVYDLLRNTSYNHHGWIGLHRKADKFYWLDNRPEEGNFKNWGKGKRSKSPSNQGCVFVMRGKYGGKWNDVECSQTIPVAICQRPI